MLPQYQSRVFECPVKDENTFIVNPKPSTPYRPVVLFQTGWSLQSDRYAPVVPVSMLGVINADECIEKFEELLRNNPNYFIVYMIKRVKSAASIGAIAFPMPIPKGYIVKTFKPLRM